MKKWEICIRNINENDMNMTKKFPPTPEELNLYRAQNEAVDGVMAGFWGKCF